MPRLQLAGAGVKKSKKAQVCQLLFAPLFHINGKQRAKVNKTNTENTVWLRQRQQGCVLRGRVAITDESVGIRVLPRSSCCVKRRAGPISHI